MCFPALLFMLLYSAQISPPPSSLSRHSLHPWISPVGEILGQLVSLPPTFCLTYTPLLPVIFLKCKSDHICFLLNMLSPAASVWHKVQTQHSIQDCLLALFQIPTPLFRGFFLPKTHFSPIHSYFKSRLESLFLYKTFPTPIHPLTLHFKIKWPTPCITVPVFPSYVPHNPLH